MTQDPTAYDLLQDHRLDALDDLVHPYYQPPSETEHSFPVVGQGVSAEMYQQMSLAQGDGILITDGSESPYILVGMPGGDSETNATNRMVLKVAANTGRAEAVIGGFYHVLYQDMPIELPPVSTPTTYYITLTYDPRREEEPTGPIKVDVHTNDPPRTHGRKHIVLHTITRQPNQLLTDAVHMLHRQYISPTITVSRGKDGLPDAQDVLYGTLGIARNRSSGGNIVPGTGAIYEARGGLGWHNLLVGPSENVYVHVGNGWTGSASCRRRVGGLDVSWNVNQGSSSSPNVTMIQLPSKYQLTSSFRTVVYTTLGPHNFEFTQGTDVVGGALFGASQRPGWTRGSVFIPDTFLAN